MAEVTKRTVRVKLETHLALPGTVELETWKANATDIQIAIYDASGVMAITDIQSVNCKVQLSQLDTTTVMDSTVAAAAMDADLIASEWVAGTDQHATFSFTNSETNLTLTSPRKSYWIVFTATLTGGEEVTLAAGTLTIHEDNNAAGDPPATNPGTAITIEEADARYLQSMDWEIKTDDFTAVNGGRYVLNNAAKAFMITLPDDVPAHTFEIVVAQWASGSLIGGTTSGTLTSSTSNVITYNAAGAWVIRSVHIPTVYSRSNHTGTQLLSTISDAGTAAAADVEDLSVSTAQQTALDLKADLISPSLVTPALGTPSSGVATNLTGTAAGLTAGATTGVEAGADVTDAANVAAAGAVMNTGNETVAGDKTLSGQLELTGQTSATANSAMTRGLVRTDAMFRDITRMGTNHWATTFTGSGGINQYESTFRISTGTTTGSSALARGNPGTLFLISANSAVFSTIDWNLRFRCRFDFAFTQNDANTVLRFQVGETYSKTTITDLDKKGYGVKIINTSIYALTHDGSTLTTSAALGSLASSTKNQVVMDSDGAGNVTFYLNGAVLVVQAGGPTTAGSANDTAVNFSSQNGAGTKFHQCILSGDVIFQYGD